MGLLSALVKGAAKTASLAKGAAKTAPSVAKTAPAAAEETNMLSMALKNWKWLGATGVVIQAQATDRNVLDVAIDDAMAIANIKKQDGETTAGAVMRSVVDTVTSDGTTDKALERLKGTGRDMSEAAHNMAETSRRVASGGSSDLLSGIGSLFRNLTSGITNFLGGGSSGLNFGALAMLPLAWFTFGKFGWIGKVGALAMLMYGLNNLFKHQAPQQLATKSLYTTRTGREQPSAKERYDAIEKQETAFNNMNEEQWTVRAKV